MTTEFSIHHNVETAHRLTELPGKCQRIHGHSMWITLTMGGDVDSGGLVGGVDFGNAKRAFRAYLDARYDHSLMLNANDVLADYGLPGAQLCDGDPTVENIARWIGEWSLMEFPQLRDHTVTVAETRTNSVTWRSE